VSRPANQPDFLFSIRLNREAASRDQSAGGHIMKSVIVGILIAAFVIGTALAMLAIPAVLPLP
jgi:hypothetical protein